MKVNECHNKYSFGKLYINIDKKLMNLPNIRKELNQIKNIIKKNKFNKKQNVDILLIHEKEKGFFGIIVSKKEGIPNNPCYKHPISKGEKVIESFKSWLDNWDYAYNPRVLRQTKKMLNKVLKEI